MKGISSVGMAAADPVAANSKDFGMPLDIYGRYTVKFTGNWLFDSVLLTFLDQYHDFGKDATDIQSQKRDTKYWDYTSAMYNTLYRWSMQLSPIYSVTFNRAGGGFSQQPEPIGLGQAVHVYRGGVPPIRIVRDNANPNPFYKELSVVLNGYRVAEFGGRGKIPIILDCSIKSLSEDCRHNSVAELINNFAIVRAKEHYVDPSSTRQMEFGVMGGPVQTGRKTVTQRINRMDYVEDGSEKRKYIDGIHFHTGMGDVLVTGGVNDIKMYYGVNADGAHIWEENYKITDNKLPNNITAAMITVKKNIAMLKNPKTFKDQKDLKILKDIIDLTSEKPYSDDLAHIQKIGIQYTKKRAADQLNASSCRKKIKFKSLNCRGGARDSCRRGAICSGIILTKPAWCSECY